MTNSQVPAARRQAHLKTSGVFKCHEGVCGLWHLETRGSHFLSHGSPPGRGDKASPVLSQAWACLFATESPRKLNERSPHVPTEEPKGWGGSPPGPAPPSAPPTLCKASASSRKRRQAGLGTSHPWAHPRSRPGGKHNATSERL